MSTKRSRNNTEEKKATAKKIKSTIPSAYNPLQYERAMREWRRWGDMAIDVLDQSTKQSAAEMFAQVNDGDAPCNHWFFLCPSLSIVSEYTVESEAREELAEILERLILDSKVNRDLANLGKHLTFVGWHSNEQDDQEWMAICESMRSQGPDIKFNLLGPGDFPADQMKGFSNLQPVWDLYYNTRFDAALPLPLGLATFKTYQDADLAGLFPKQDVRSFKSFCQYRHEAALHLIWNCDNVSSDDGKSLWHGKFQADKDQELWAEHWFWAILETSTSRVINALLDTKDTKLWFDGHRCIGLENVRRKKALQIRAKVEAAAKIKKAVVKNDATVDHFQRFVAELNTLQIPNVVQDNKLVFEADKYSIIFSPIVKHMTSSNPFLDIEIELKFQDRKFNLDAFDMTGIIGHRSSDTVLEVSDLVPKSAYPSIYGKYAAIVLPFLHAEAKKHIEGVEKPSSMDEEKKLKNWHDSLQAIACGLEKKYKATIDDEEDQDHAIPEQYTIWIPVDVNSNPVDCYQVGLKFNYDNDANFVQMLLQFGEEDQWEDLEVDDNSEGGFGFIPLWLLTPENAFDVFMAHFEIVLPAFVSMCERHAEESE